MRLELIPGTPQELEPGEELYHGHVVTSNETQAQLGPRSQMSRRSDNTLRDATPVSDANTRGTSRQVLPWMVRAWYTKEKCSADAPTRLGAHFQGPASLFVRWAAMLYIGTYCSIASEVQIFLGGEHRPDWVSTYPFPALAAD